MLKITFDETQIGENWRGPFGVETNDRGCWELHTHLPESGVTVFLGYGGENSLSFHETEMQDGSVDFVAVHSSCDNPARVAQKRIAANSLYRGNTQEKRNAAFNEAIACLLAQVGAYDPLEGEDGEAE